MKNLLKTLLITPIFAMAAPGLALSPQLVANGYLHDIDKKITSIGQNQNDVVALNQILGNSNINPAGLKSTPLLTNTQYVQLFCQGNEAEGYNLSTTWVSSSAKSQCEDALAVGNANSVLPLDMSLQSKVNLSSTQSGGATGIDAYIGSLLTAPSANASIPDADKPNNAPELTLVSGVLRSISNVYQSGEMTQINNSVDAPFDGNRDKFMAKLSKANSPELMRMLVLQNAKSNYINARALTQRQKTNALLAVILADQVKIRALQNAAVHQNQQLTKTNQLLSQILSTQVRNARKPA